MPQDLIPILSNWMKLLKIPVSRTLLQLHLEQHPDYPSVLSITDTLDELGISNLALKVEKSNMHQLSLPFLAQVSRNGGAYELVTSSAMIGDPSSSLYGRCTGIVILAEKRPEPIRSDHQLMLAKEKKNRIRALVLLIVLPALLLWACTPPIASAILLLTSYGGIFISTLIIMQELGISNDLTEALCHSDTNENCQDVIRSTGSKMFSWLGLGDLCLIFFITQSFLMIIADLRHEMALSWPVLKYTSVISLLFVLYSLYYQWRIAKKWCRLCLIVTGLLLLQAVFLLPPSTNWTRSQQFKSVAFFIAAFLAISAVWLLLKPLLQQVAATKDKLMLLMRFRNDADIFSRVLLRERKVDTTPFTNELELCTAGKPLQIMVACNPYCSPCARTHTVLHQIAERYHTQISLTIRFTIHARNKDDRKTRAAAHIINKSKEIRSGKGATVNQLLNDWFFLMDLDKFMEAYPMKGAHLPSAGDGDEAGETDRDLREHSEWAKNNFILFTPGIFINGYELPRRYKANDLFVLIRGLLSNDELESNFCLQTKAEEPGALSRAN